MANEFIVNLNQRSKGRADRTDLKGAQVLEKSNDLTICSSPNAPVQRRRYAIR
jgi:hypothetical protein